MSYTDIIVWLSSFRCCNRILRNRDTALLLFLSQRFPFKNGAIGLHHCVLLELQNEVLNVYSHATITIKLATVHFR